MPAVRTGRLLFVAGHDPEWAGRLRYRGRVGDALDGRAARAALRLATLNALASARAEAGSLARVRRCVALTGFVHAAPDALEPGIAGPSLRLVMSALGHDGRRPTPPASPAAPAPPTPIVWLRPAQGLAGGMSVEVELILEIGIARTVTRRRSGRRR